MSSPDRFLSVYLCNGERRWSVIGEGGMPECAPTDVDSALTVWRRIFWPAGRDIPVWDGDEGRWGHLSRTVRGMVAHDPDELSDED